MLKRYCTVICAAAILLLCAACGSKPAPPAEQPDGMFMWNGLRLIREDNIGWQWGNVDVIVPENVLTAKDQNLTVSFKSRGGVYEYGFKEYIQVYLDGAWYSFAQELAQNEERLLLDSYQGHYDENENRTEHTVDFSVIGELPPGKYRLVETFYDGRFKEESYALANFWIISPGEKRPSESETTGKPKKEDINLYAQSLYEARRDITDRDIWFCIYVENLSGKKYCIDHEKESNPPVLEKKQNGKWIKIDYRHVNAGMMFGWTTDRNEFFLDKPLSAGHYRLRVPVYVLYETGMVEIQREFDVIAYKNAPEPAWEISRLSPSPYDAISKAVTMTLKNPVVNKENSAGLEITLAADRLYNYGEPYEVEVLLGGKWYRVPFASGAFFQPLYIFDPNNPDMQTQRGLLCHPVQQCGVLPAGRYRILKEFTVPDTSAAGGYLAREIAAVEFTVEETVGSEDYYIESMRESESE